MASSLWSRVICAGLVGLVAFAVYWNNIDDYFFGDDFDLIQSFQDQPPSYFLKLLASDETNFFWDPDHREPMIRPVKMWLLKLDQMAWGAQDATGFHVTGTVFFAAVAILVFLIADQLLPKRLELALLAGLLAAIHPVFSEIVPSITFREEAIATAFGLAAFFFFLRHRKGKGGRAGFPIFFMLALFTKESGAFFLALPLTFDFVHVVFTNERALEFRRRLGIYIPIACIVAVYAGLRWWGLGGSLGTSSNAVGYSYPFDFLVWLIAILRFFVHPNMLSVPSWLPLIPVLVLGGLACAFLLWRNRSHLSREYWITLLFVGPGWLLASVACIYGIYFDARHNVLPVLGVIFFGVALLGGTTATAGRIAKALSFSLVALVASAALLPPTLSMSRKFEQASITVETVRRDIENQTRHLPDGSTILLINIPQVEDPPYFFGWGLLSSLKKPFTKNDLANRMVVINHMERQFNNRTGPIPNRYDYTYVSEKRFSDAPKVWSALAWDTAQRLRQALIKTFGGEQVPQNGEPASGSLGPQPNAG